MKRRSTMLLLGTLAALWMVPVPHAPAQAPTEEELKEFERQAEQLEQEQAAAKAEAKRKAEAAKKAAAADEAKRKSEAAKEAAAAAEAKRAAAQKKAEEERRAADEARSASQEASALAGEFVDIPGGTFQMGCSPGDGECRGNERPVHTVSIKLFRMGKYEVTVGQFRRFVQTAGYRTDAEGGGNCAVVQADGRLVEQAGRDWHNPGFPQTERDPVVCVSWNDVEAYVQWLSRQGGGRYRLPSESEWEYAARAGGSGRYSFGDSEGMLWQYGNMDSATSCDDGALYTAPVGGYRPNGFGLHDMHGNVSEWTEDCYHDSYAGAPSDGDAWTAGDCARRVFRGGSWGLKPRWVNSSFRGPNTPDKRSDFLGFRLLQDPTEALPTPTTLPSVGGSPHRTLGKKISKKEISRRCFR